MKVVLDLDRYRCTVTREDGDPKFYNSGWTYAESTFLYHVKKELIKQGYDVIKKRMSSDGHLVDQYQQYIRTRDMHGDDAFMIYYGNSYTNDAGNKFNNTGEVMLVAERINGKKQTVSP